MQQLSIFAQSGTLPVAEDEQPPATASPLRRLWMEGWRDVN